MFLLTAVPDAYESVQKNINACAVLSCFLVPGTEYRRVFGPLSDADKPRPLSLYRLVVMAALFSFTAVFIYLPVFAYLELWVQQTSKMRESRQMAESWIIPKLEQIDGAFFKEGTLAKLQNARVEALHNVELSLVRLEGQADRAFDRLEANVDDYLDWYYSLAGEYGRITQLMIGELDDYMIEKLEESLEQGDAFKGVQAALNTALSEHRKALDAYHSAAQTILKENRVDSTGSQVHVVQRMKLKDVLDLPDHQDMIGLESRLIAGGGGGAMAGVITAVIIERIVGKVLGKNIFKLAAKSLTKIVISKTAGSAGGAGAGAAAGAAVGSVLPGPGTVIGAVIGGIIGTIAVGMTVDKVLIELEESINREEFKRGILSAVREARMEFKAKLRGEV